MKNKILKIVLAVVLVVVVVAAIVLVVTKVNDKKPADSVLSFTEALQNGDFDTAKSYTSDETWEALEIDTESDDLEMMTCYFKCLNVNVEEVTKSKDQAIVKVEFTNKNLKTIIQKYIQKALELAMSTINSSSSEDDMETQLLDYFKSLFDSDEIENVTTSVDVVLNKVDGEWKVVVTEELRDAMLPGLSELNNLYTVAA
jgi:hypothetical protein